MTRARGVLWHVLPRGVLALAPNSSDAVLLGGTAAELWQLLADGVTAGSAVEHLAVRCGVDADEIEEPIRLALDQMVASGLAARAGR